METIDGSYWLYANDLTMTKAEKREFKKKNNRKMIVRGRSIFKIIRIKIEKVSSR